MPGSQFIGQELQSKNRNRKAASRNKQTLHVWVRFEISHKASSSYPPFAQQLIKQHCLDVVLRTERQETALPLAAESGEVISQASAVLVIEPEQFADRGDVERAGGLRVDKSQIAGQLGVDFRRSEDLQGVDL